MRRSTAVRLGLTCVGAALVALNAGAGCDFSCQSHSEPPTAAQKVDNIVKDAVQDAKETGSDVKVTVTKKPD